MTMAEKMTEQEKRLFEMTGYPEYDVWLQTTGLAFHFNAFVKQALDDEKHVAHYEDFLKTTQIGSGEGKMSLMDAMQTPEQVEEELGPNQVRFRGRTMMKDWPERLANVQVFTTIHDAETDEAYKRIPNDKEDICHDCATLRGELHMPGCDMEKCPKCQGQTISCGCKFDHEDEG